MKVNYMIFYDMSGADYVYVVSISYQDHTTACYYNRTRNQPSFLVPEYLMITADKDELRQKRLTQVRVPTTRNYVSGYASESVIGL